MQIPSVSTSGMLLITCARTTRLAPSGMHTGTVYIDYARGGLHMCIPSQGEHERIPPFICD